MARNKLYTVGLVWALVVLAVCEEIDIKNPVRSAEEDEVKSLPGLNYKPKFKHFSGYLEADALTPSKRFWHYWFTESATPNEDPLVLWLNGGPGCSSVMGLLTEQGPFRVDNESIVNNPWAWNEYANVLFLESPAGVGYSYTTDGDEKADDDTTAFYNYRALKSFFKKFPQYVNRPLYLTGESYGGVYIPTLAVLVDEDSTMNLKGIAVGNGFLDVTKLAVSQVLFDYYHGLMGLDAWQQLSDACCGSAECSRTTFKFPLSENCSLAMATTTLYAEELNPYNIYDKCRGDQSTLNNNHTSRETFDLSLMRHAIENAVSKPQKVSRRKSAGQRFDLSKGFTSDPPCTDDSVQVSYLNRDDVRKALHIPKEVKSFESCYDGLEYQMKYAFRKNGMAQQIMSLNRSDRLLDILIYNGDVDTVCNFIGDEWFSDDLNLKVTKQYRPWFVDEQLAGFVKNYGRLTFATVKGSGHMVPTDKPKEAFLMLYAFLTGHEQPGISNFISN